MIFCDREPLAIHCALSSAQLNGLEVHSVNDISISSQGVAGAVLDWAAPLGALAQSADVVLGADCLYDPTTAAMLAKTCKHLLDEDGVVVICEPEKERALGTSQSSLNARNLWGRLQQKYCRTLTWIRTNHLFYFACRGNVSDFQADAQF